MTDVTAFLVALALRAPPPVPAEEQEPFVVVTNVYTSRARCNRTVAIKVSLPVLVEEPQTWLGKCVAVDGYWQRSALFASREEARRWHASSAEAVGTRPLGLYAKGKRIARAPQRATAYTAVGIVGDCESLRTGPTMVFGYCHYSNGPYLATAELRRRR